MNYLSLFCGCQWLHPGKTNGMRFYFFRNMSEFEIIYFQMMTNSLLIFVIFFVFSKDLANAFKKKIFK